MWDIFDFSWGDADRDAEFVDREDSRPPLAIEDGTLSDDETPTTEPEQSPEHDDLVVPSSDGVETTTENSRVVDMMEASQRMELEKDPNDMGVATPAFYDPTSDADLENPYMGPLPDSPDPMCVADPTWTDSQPEYDESQSATHQSHDKVTPIGAPDSKTDAALMPPPPPVSAERVAKRRQEIEAKINETRLGSKIVIEKYLLSYVC